MSEKEKKKKSSGKKEKKSIDVQLEEAIKKVQEISKKKKGWNPPIVIKQSSYNNVYQNVFAEQLMNHIKRGMSFESFQTTPPTSKRVHYIWLKDRPDFLEALEDGEMFYQRILEQNLSSKATGVLPKGINDEMTKEMQENVERANLKAIQYTLSSRYTKTYKQKIENVIQNPDGSKIEPQMVVDLSKLTLKELEALEKIQDKMGLDGQENTSNS